MIYDQGPIQVLWQTSHDGQAALVVTTDRSQYCSFLKAGFDTPEQRTALLNQTVDWAMRTDARDTEYESTRAEKFCDSCGQEKPEQEWDEE